MPKYSEEFKEQLRELRDVYLAGVEDKTDPRYVALMAHIAENDAMAGRKARQPSEHAAR